MSLIVTGDLHLSDNPRDHYRHVWMDSFIELVRKRQPEAVAILGDLTEEKDRHCAALVNDVVNYLHNLSEICPVIGLQGNHDYIADPDNGFWPFLKHIPRVAWLTRPTRLTNISGFPSLLFLPHTRNYKQDWDGVEFKGHDWIFCHNTFEGSDTGHGHKLGGIPLGAFPPLGKSGEPRVISGDVHMPQVVGPVTYAGSPYLCDFGDDYQPRILLLEGHTKKSIPCPGIQKRLIEIKGVEELKLQNHVQKGDILKVRVSLSMKERDQWPQVQKEVRAWAEKQGCVVHAVQPNFKMEAGQRTRLAPKRSDEDTLKKYAAAGGITGPVLDTGLEFIEKGE
jgi:Calcineurin-like phosphoesterase